VQGEGSRRAASNGYGGSGSADVLHGPAASISELLRLLAAGAAAAIILALGDGPLRTKVLTEQVAVYTPRTIYRYLPKLTELGAVRREEGAEAPAKVVHRLTDPAGIQLHHLVRRLSDPSLGWLRDDRTGAPAWGSLGVLADLWDAGVVEALSRGARSPTELARGLEGLSYHQVNRRALLFKEAGFLCEWEQLQGQQRCYALTDKARRAMGLIAALGWWRSRNLAGRGDTGMTVSETATVLRASLPLVKLPDQAGKRLEIYVAGKGAEAGPGEGLWLEVDVDGGLNPCEAPSAGATGSGRGDPEAWLATILDGKPRIATEGDEGLVAACLGGLAGKLWT